MLLAVAAESQIIAGAQNQEEVDSNMSAAFSSTANTLVQASNEASVGMTAQVNEQSSSESSSSDTNNDLVVAQQVQATEQTLLQAMQKNLSAFQTSASNQVSTDTNDIKSVVNLNNYIQAASSTISSLLASSY